MLGGVEIERQGGVVSVRKTNNVSLNTTTEYNELSILTYHFSINHRLQTLRHGENLLINELLRHQIPAFNKQLPHYHITPMRVLLKDCQQFPVGE